MKNAGLRLVGLVLMSLFIPAVGSTASSAKLIITCTSDDCVYRRISNFAIGGRQSVKLVRQAGGNLSQADIKNAREATIDQIAGLYRDPVSGVIFALGPDATPHDTVVPVKFEG